LLQQQNKDKLNTNDKNISENESVKVEATEVAKVKLNVEDNIKGDEVSNDLEAVILNESDHADMSIILEKNFPDCSVNMKSFLNAQRMALQRHPFGRRWKKDIIRLCLTLWCRSPRGYSELRNSNFMILPSKSVLQKYKNIVHQEAGINKEVLHWMSNEAKLKNIPPDGV
jgi:hypothetical protein